MALVLVVPQRRAIAGRAIGQGVRGRKYGTLFGPEMTNHLAGGPPAKLSWGEI